MISRWIAKKLEHALTVRRGVNLTGARQTGKTTLAAMLDLASCKRVSLDDRLILAAAKKDPADFVRRESCETLVVDEIQKAPELLDAIKLELDHCNCPGQYLLTGSANLHFSKAVTDSLAGRLGRIRLRTLALGEIRGVAPVFLERAFSRNFKPSYGRLDKSDIISLCFAGGYPEARLLDRSDRQSWYETYLDELISKDVRDITQIRKKDVLAEVALWLLAHSSQFFSVEELAAKCGVSKATVETYLETLKAMFIFDCVPAWTRSDYERAGKRGKYIACDPGLISNLLYWNEREVNLDGRRNGRLVESWVYHELAACAEASGNYRITHYRDKDQREIDFLVEGDDGCLLGIEVKSGQATEEDFKHLKWFGKKLAKSKFTGLVLHAGDKVLSYGNGLYAVPLAALGED